MADAASVDSVVEEANLRMSLDLTGLDGVRQSIAWRIRAVRALDPERLYHRVPWLEALEVARERQRALVSFLGAYGGARTLGMILDESTRQAFRERLAAWLAPAEMSVLFPHTCDDGERVGAVRQALWDLSRDGKNVIIEVGANNIMRPDEDEFVGFREALGWLILECLHPAWTGVPVNRDTIRGIVGAIDERARPYFDELFEGLRPMERTWRTIDLLAKNGASLLLRQVDDVAREASALAKETASRRVLVLDEVRNALTLQHWERVAESARLMCIGVSASLRPQAAPNLLLSSQLLRLRAPLSGRPKRWLWHDETRFALHYVEAKAPQGTCAALLALMALRDGDLAEALALEGASTDDVQSDDGGVAPRLIEGAAADGTVGLVEVKPGTGVIAVAAGA